MTDRQAAEERLKEAFQSLGETARAGCSEEDLERVWRAVSGELPAAERRELVDRMAADPACAEAWRVAQQFWQASPSGVVSASRHRPQSWASPWLAVAAVLLVGVTVGIVQFNRPAEDAFRDEGRQVVESMVPSDTTLSRDAFWLRWAPGPSGSRYHVRVTTEDLRVLTTIADLMVPEFRVQGDLLSSLAPGARVLWQVDVALPGGESVSSQTFVVRVQ